MPARSYMPSNRKDSVGRKFARAIDQGKSMRTEDQFLKNPPPRAGALSGHSNRWPSVSSQRTGASPPTRSRSIRQHKRMADYG